MQGILWCSCKASLTVSFTPTSVRHYVFIRREDKKRMAEPWCHATFPGYAGHAGVRPP
jgi:hypothetical protein